MMGQQAKRISVLPAPEHTRMEIHTKKVLEDMREISSVCNTTGHRWALWTLLNDLMELAGDIERETDRKKGVRYEDQGKRPDAGR